MRALLMFMFLALVLGVSTDIRPAQVDNEWLTPTYGAPGDTVIDDIKSQIASYKASKMRAEVIQKGDMEGNLRDAQESCIEYALYSYVKAMYAAEMGRVAALKGNTKQAIEDYRRCKAFAKIALNVSHLDSNLVKTSKEIGKTFLAKANSQLKKLGG